MGVHFSLGNKDMKAINMKESRDDLERALKVRVSRLVRALMAERGWVQTDLARESGASQKTISNLLSQTHLPGVVNLERIAGAFGVPSWTLLHAPAAEEALRSPGRAIKTLRSYADRL